ncbi:hypothetical protein D3C76_1407250 [compost metagenome]
MSPSIGLLNAVRNWATVSRTFWVWWLSTFTTYWSPDCCAGVLVKVKSTPAAEATLPVMAPLATGRLSAVSGWA